MIDSRFKEIFLKEKLQGRLLKLAALFLFLNAVSLTLSAAVRSHSFDVSFRWGHWAILPIWAVVYYFIDKQLNRRGFTTDPLLLPLAALLTGWGILNIWRLTTQFGLRQSVWLVVAGVIFITGLRLPSDLAFLRRFKYLWLSGGLVLTGLTLFFGINPTGYGLRLWLGCCGVYIQPSEPLKLLLIIFLAAYLSDRQAFTPGLMALLAPTAAMAGFTLLLLVIQRDLGTASIFMFIYTGVIFVATGKKRTLLFSLLTISLAGGAGYFLFDVVRLRVDAWINPWLDPSGRSFQVVQSLIAVAAGGMAGRGPGMGNPGLVPIAHSDFIFATIAEEYGLVGVIALLLTLMILSMRAIRTGITAASRFHRYLAFGVSLYFASQSLLIIGGNIRLLPLTGVTLPLVSYGGSSLVTSFIALLLLTHIRNYAPDHPLPKQKSSPYLLLSAIIMAGFTAAALVASWWGLWRGPDLLTRTDNARRTISDRFVPRGAIRDRNGLILSQTTGQPGAYHRTYLHPALSPILGYTHPFFGQAGAEADLDPILRGLEHQNPWVVWYNHLLYGQPPSGLDLKLSLDLELQTKAETLLGNTPGALVLLDANSGQIIALASVPGFNANHMEEDWEELNQSTDAPLLNRATLGSYPPGPALGAFLQAAAGVQGALPEFNTLSIQVDSQILDCALSVPSRPTWTQVIAAGCPAPLTDLGLKLGSAELISLFAELGFYTAPDIRLPSISLKSPVSITKPGVEGAGQGNLKISPLQLALAVAALNNRGVRPAPQILLEIENPEGGWDSTSPRGDPAQIFTPQMASRITAGLQHPSLPLWETTALAITASGGTLTWYLGGSLPEQAEGSYVVVVLLEIGEPILARSIGHQILINLTE